MKDFKEETLKKEAIRNFVCKNYSEEIPKKTSDIELSKVQKKIVKHFLKKSIGPNKDGLILLLKDGEECLTINQKGDIFGPS